MNKRRGWVSGSSVGTKRGYIYFAMSDDHVKIGFTNDVRARLPCLQTGNHEVIVMEEYFASYVEAERLLHDRFQSDHVLNEWFRITPEVEELIEDIYDYQICNTSELENRHEVFFELEDVKQLLAEVVPSLSPVHNRSGDLNERRRV